MTENNYPLAIRFTAATKLALGRAAAVGGMSVAQYIETTMARVPADAENAAGRVDEMAT
jgi:hypothetical protein